MQLNRWRIPLCYDLFRKRIDPKNLLFIETNDRTLLAVPWSVEYFFAPNYPIFQRSRREEEDGENRQMQSALLFNKNNLIKCSRNFLKLK